VRAAACAVAGLLALTTCSDAPRGGHHSDPRPVTVPASLSSIAPDTSLGAIRASFDATNPHVVQLAVTAPPTAQEMQVSTDPSFRSASWSPVGPHAEVPMYDSGYVMVFARFRAGDTVTRPVVAGVTIDRRRAAAIAGATGRHRAADVGLVGPSVLSLTFETGRVEYGAQEPYDFDQPVDGDQLDDAEGGVKMVVRNGTPYGLQIAPGVDGLLRYDVVIGRELDGAALDNASDYEITSTDDDAYRTPRAATGTARTTRPIGLARTAAGDATPVAHEVLLQLPSPLRSGATYTITMRSDDIEPVHFEFDERASRSPAVHANQLGYRPGDPSKVAFVSTFTERAGFVSLPDSLGFDVIDARTDETVFSGTAQPDASARDEYGKGDLTASTVYRLDFSALDVAGRYRVCVAAIGCSYEFAVDEFETWLRGMVGVARAMYHQRSGIALGGPFTAIDRPRVFHPDDGVVAHQSKATLMETGNGPLGGEQFRELVDGATDEVVADAWGGHFDAGDWDRRVEHLWYLRSAIDLIELFPDYFRDLDLDIPESQNAVPDLLDEGLWDLDLYRRLQLPNGAVRGGLESDEHPAARTTSWTLMQPVFAYAPDPYASYLYAGVAAQAARVLREYDASRATEYEQSALAAMNWAEQQKVPSRLRDEVESQRSVAAAALFRLTGDARWHDVFLETTPLVDGPIDLLGCHDHNACDSAWIYARTDTSATRSEVRDNALESFRRNAAQVLDGQASTAFGWSIEHPYIPLVWGLGPSTPKTIGLLRAHALFGDRQYCAAAVSSAAFSFGANPLNTTFFTGIGAQNPRTPLIVDSLNGGVPYWPGTPVFGLHQLSQEDDWVARYVLRPAATKPDPDQTPYLLSWYDMFNTAQFNEFTVFQSHAVALFGLGYLAAADC
jgi:endoglucanase